MKQHHDVGLRFANPTYILRADVAERLALERYETFDAGRREATRLAADAEDVAALERVERKLEGKGRGKKK